MARRPCIRCGTPTTNGPRCPGCTTPRDEAARPAHRKAYKDPAYLKARAQLIGLPCWICGAPATTADHLVPLAHGGTNDPSNLAPACGPCNSRRGATQ